MKIFVISDTHFHHQNVIQYANRPFKTAEEMDEEMIKRWNKVVGKEDIVFHLGDFALWDEDEIKKLRQRLNGTIFLFRGNHDHRKKVDNAGFIIIEGTLEMDNLIFSHYPLTKEEIPKGFINIHGHIHAKDSYYGINVSVERIDYTPIPLEKVKYIKAQNLHF